MAIARQTWDEVRHANLAKGLIENYGAKIGDFPDTLAGGAPPNRPATGANSVAESYAAIPEEIFRDPVVSLSMTNVSLEGGALTLFQETSKVGEKLGDDLMAHCYDYNWADEVTHVSIGDYFVKKLTEGDPQKERFALMAHARHEMMRGNLTAEQAEELKTFFAEEMERAEEALVTDQPAAGGYR
jgi:uncharacterized ferritin-like protein (DUF455 family)